MGRPGLSLDRKFKRLARALDDVQAGFGEMLARGALELLWDSAYEACEDYLGDVDDVESQAHWRGKSGTLAAALQRAGGEGRAGFIEEGGSEWWADGRPGTYRIHDLWDHAPEYVEKRARREQEREAKGTTLSEVRSAAGKKGRRMQLEAARADGASYSAPGGPAAGQCPAPGGQADVSCPVDQGLARANGETPAPSPARTQPAPAPSPPPTPSADAVGLADGRLATVRSELATRLGKPRMLGLGRNPDDAVRSFNRWLELAGEDLLLRECMRLAEEKHESPNHLAWWVGWLDSVSDGQLRKGAAQAAGGMA